VMRGRAEFPATWAGERAVTVAAGETSVIVGSACRECHHQAAPADTTTAEATRAISAKVEAVTATFQSLPEKFFWRLPAAGTTGATSCSRVAREGAIDGESWGEPVSCVQSASEVLCPVRSLVFGAWGGVVGVGAGVLAAWSGGVWAFVVLGACGRAGASARIASTVSSAEGSARGRRHR